MPYGIKNSSKINDSLSWFVCQLCIAITSWKNVETCPPFTTTYFSNFRSITKAMKSCLSKLGAFIITNHLHVPFAKVSFSLLCFTTIFVSCFIIFIVHYMCFIIFSSITKACCSPVMLHYRFWIWHHVRVILQVHKSKNLLHCSLLPIIAFECGWQLKFESIWFKRTGVLRVSRREHICVLYKGHSICITKCIMMAMLLGAMDLKLQLQLKSQIASYVSFFPIKPFIYVQSFPFISLHLLFFFLVSKYYWRRGKFFDWMF